MLYKAFISYSHAADNKLAPALESALRSFAKPPYKLRAMNVFRDKTSLHMTHELWPLIQKSLNESEFFILLASPDAARSEWVQKEIGEWLKIKDGSLDKFLIVLTDGQLQWNGPANDFDWGNTSSLPSTLKGKFKNEPLYLDFRWARNENDLSFRNPDFLDSVATISATLHNKHKADMIGADVRSHRIYKMLVTGAIFFLALSIGALSMSFYAFRQRAEAVKQRGEAERQRNIAEETRRDAELSRQRSDTEIYKLNEQLRWLKRQ